ncbi:hypothetical protein PMAYCL1PPCAC_13095, partial [Pristionchus mayeri]
SRSEEVINANEAELAIPENGGEFADDDLLSRLPALCLIEIFKKCTRTGIRSMSMVSKKMYTITNDSTLDAIKWDGGVLTIRKTVDGFAARLGVRASDYPWERTVESIDRVSIVHA